ncbi:restriction endonuclease subunit S [Pseudoalteromonas piscicida]|uniref:restriction endonuclease subunit S n=1 Tax=Pseudoalteromonas piscicida TaxID=43662 RepID=UPI001D0AD74D|nr:restriction endonuclease subunit S [Pseudoalteromonas piscicida]UDM62460.1 restriction endonuclease subunit S [Pseudoalteromonas piscicida]
MLETKNIKGRKQIYVEGSYSHTLTIPASWEFAKFSEVIEIIGGSQPPKSEFMSEPQGDCIRLIQIRDYKSDANIVYIPKAKAKRFVNKNEVMIGRYGPPIFQILRGLEGAYNVALMKANPLDGILLNDYLFRFLNNQNIYNYVESASDRTAGQSGVNKKHLEQYPVGIPPLKEQKRIVEKLDDVLAQVDAIKGRLDSIPAIIKRFRQSVLASAVSGKLTEEWRDNFSIIESVLDRYNAYKAETISSLSSSAQKNKLIKIHQETEHSEFILKVPKSWEIKNLNKIAVGFNYGSSSKSQKQGSVPVLRMGNIQAGKLDWNDLVFTSDEIEIDKYRLTDGDVLFNRTNSPELVGKTAIFRGEEDAIYAGYLIKVQGSKMLNAEFLNIVLNSRHAKNYCMSVKTDGVSQSNINAQKLGAFPCPLPPVEEQKEIVRLVDEYFALADTIEAQVNKARARVDKLTQSILAKAFRGELVPQDDNDEPAEKLLERIAQAKAEAEALAKAVKKAEAGKKRAAKTISK